MVLYVYVCVGGWVICMWLMLQCKKIVFFRGFAADYLLVPVYSSCKYLPRVSLTMMAKFCLNKR